MNQVTDVGQLALSHTRKTRLPKGFYQMGHTWKIQLWAVWTLINGFLYNIFDYNI